MTNPATNEALARRRRGRARSEATHQLVALVGLSDTVTAVAGDDDGRLPAELDPRLLRVSDAEREHVAGLLQKAVGLGLITLDEFTERTDKALGAQTRGELNSVLTDLPFVQQTTAPPTEQPLVLHTGSGNLAQRGRWDVPATISAECGMGNITIDFTEATCRHPEVTLRATCGMGNIVAIVPRGWGVVLVEATSGMGSITNKATDPQAAGQPVLRVYGKARMGHVKIRHPRGRR
jgi:hypothetical protein